MQGTPPRARDFMSGQKERVIMKLLAITRSLDLGARSYSPAAEVAISLRAVNEGRSLNSV